MRDRAVLRWALVCGLLLGACDDDDPPGPTTDASGGVGGGGTGGGGAGGGGTGGTGGGDASADGSFSGPPMQPTPAERPTVRIRVVHLFSPGMGQPGPAVDVYRTGELHARQREAMPIVAGLAYGQASPWFSPVGSLLMPGDLGNTTMFFDAGTRTLNGGTYGGFMLRENLRDGDKVTVVMLPARPMMGVTAPAWRIEWEARPAAPSSVPAAVAGQAVVITDDAGVATSYGATFRFHLGSGSTCQMAVGDTGAPGLLSGGTRFAFAPGALSLTAHRFAEPANCAGTPAAGPTGVEGTADGRTWLWIYGPAMTDLRLFTLPFGP
jgi:hypothetical protein